jgi:replicative DNA helicase
MTRTPLKLPEDIESERALLATLCAAGTLDPGSENLDAHHAALGVNPEQLVHPAHNAVLAALQALYRDGQPVDSLSLKAKLEAMGTLARVGGYPGLIEILGGEEVGRPSRLVDRLLDLWRQREVMKAGHHAMTEAANAMNPVQDVISTLASRLSALAAGSIGPKIRKASTLVDRIVAGEAFRDLSIGAKLVWTGLECFDEALECSPGHVVMVGARPGVGKSALAIQIAWVTANHGGRPFLISLEMDDGEVDARLASWQSREGYRVFRDARWSDASAHALMEASPVMDQISVWCHGSQVPWSTVEAAIRDAVRLNGATSVIIDHVLLIQKPELGKGSNDAACWLFLSRSIKKLAGELGICIVPLCQLNRQGAEGEPKLSDFRDSGGWEEDAVAVLMIWQVDAQAAEEMLEVRDLWIKQAKNRSGPSGWKKKVEFRGATNHFDIEVHETDSPCAAISRPVPQAGFWNPQA